MEMQCRQNSNLFLDDTERQNVTPQGPCQNQKPFFGIVRRSMNRPPQPADRWWADHQKSCGGTYTKIAGPDLDENGEVKLKKGKRKAEKESGAKEVKVEPGQRTIDDMFGSPSKKVKAEDTQGQAGDDSPTVADAGVGSKCPMPELGLGDIKGKSVDVRFPGQGHRLDGEPSVDATPTPDLKSSQTLIHCPVCGAEQPEADINPHLDACLA